MHALPHWQGQAAGQMSSCHGHLHPWSELLEGHGEERGEWYETQAARFYMGMTMIHARFQWIQKWHCRNVPPTRDTHHPSHCPQVDHERENVQAQADKVVTRSSSATSKIKEHGPPPVLEYAHRLVAWASYGPPADSKMIVHHTCSNTRCLSPAHLMWGSQESNMRERVARQRRRK